jgi:hypothetical protein
MIGIHPNLRFVSLAALSLALASAGGCSHNQTAGITNPFMPSDRVAPPSTRVIAPGTAQPYYPGDPLPVMQSAAPGAAAAPVATTIAASAAPAAEPKQIAFSNEPTVAIPNDESPLRFELPAPPEPEPTPIAAAAPTPAAPSNSTSVAPASGVMPAVYNAPMNGGQPLANVMPAAALAEPVVSNPWRSPQIAGTTPRAVYPPAMQQFGSPPVVQPTVVPGYVFVPPTAAVPPGMDVTLRAVPSPPPLPGESSTPRIRIPGYPAPPATMTPVPPSTLGGSSDGFRPRSSMR